MSLKTPRWSKEGELIRTQLESEGKQEFKWGLFFDDYAKLSDKVDSAVTYDAYHLALDKLHLAKQQLTEIEAENSRLRSIKLFTTSLLFIAIVLGVVCFNLYKTNDALNEELMETAANYERLSKRYDTLYQKSKIVPYENGEMIKAPTSDAVCPLTISVSGTSGYFVYLKAHTLPENANGYTKRQNELKLKYGLYDIAFMVKPHGTVEIDVPIGEYTLYYASGENWYGVEDKFGEETLYFKAGQALKFTADNKHYYGHTIELWEQIGGNMTEIEINESDFPS